MDVTSIKSIDPKKFVGRKEEQIKFNEILSDPRGKKRTLYIQASGGQGKTWLIKMMLLSASGKQKVVALDPGRLVDMYSTSNRYIEGVMAVLEQRLVEKLGKGDFFAPYYDACQALERARAQEDYSSDEISNKVSELRNVFRKCIEEIVKEQTIVLAFDTFENVDGTEVKEWILSDNGLQIPNLITLIGSRTPWTDEDVANYTSVELLELSGLSDSDAIELYLSYTGEARESISDTRKNFIRILNEKSNYNPLMLGLAITYFDAVNNEPEDVENLSLTEFEKEVVSWLSLRNGPPGSVYIGTIEFKEQMRQAVVLMSYLNRRFDKYFLEKLCKNDFIQMETATVDSLWQELEHKKPDLFFVKERQGGEIQLHDKLAELLRKHVLVDAFSDVTGERLRKFTDSIIEWYKERIEKVDKESRNLFQAEQLAYLLRSDLFTDCQNDVAPSPEICTKLDFLAPQPEAIVSDLEKSRLQRSDVLARLIIGEAKSPLIERFGGAQKHDIFRLLGNIAEQCYEHEAAQKYFEMAYKEAVKMEDPFKQVLALLDQHNSTFQMDTQKSFELLDLAESICKSDNAKNLLPKVLYEKGFTFSVMNDLLQASEWYLKAKKEATRLEDKEMMPTILNDEGYNFLLVGKLPSARISIRAARDHRYREYMDLREQLEHNNLTDDQRVVLEDKVREAAKMLGLSYSTLGDLARYSNRLDEALTRYSEAMENFEYSNSRYWQAKMYFTIGETYRRIAVADFIAGRDPKFKEMDALAEENIKESVTLCEQYGFRNDLDTAYRRLGRLHHDRMFRTPNLESQLEHLDDARKYFKKALSLAKETSDQLEILESMTELAFLADDYLSITQSRDPERFEAEKVEAKRDIDALESYIKESPAENRVFQFPVFEHLLEIEKAAYHFALENYEKSLSLYIKGYVGMAKLPGYGVARFLQHLDHLVSYLKRLFHKDKVLGREWCEALIAAWEDEGLMEQRPELPQEVSMVRDTSFLLN